MTMTSGAQCTLAHMAFTTSAAFDTHTSTRMSTWQLGTRVLMLMYPFLQLVTAAGTGDHDINPRYSKCVGALTVSGGCGTGGWQ